jgi:hypothetical protein
MICPYCGRENPDTLQACDYCGASLATHVDEQAPAAAEAKPAVETWQDNELPESLRKAVEQTPPRPATGIYGNKIWWIIGGAALLFFIVACCALAWGIFHFTNRLVSTPPPGTATVMIAAPTATTITGITTEQTSSVIYSDDFSDPNSGWDRVNESDFYSDYYNGAYRILVNTDMYDSWANPGYSVFGDVSIEVDATKNGGPDDNDFGVICRYQGVEAFYYAIISSDGYYGITKVTSDNSELLGHDELLPSNAIKQGEALNHIRFDCFADQLSLYANGILLDQQSDGEYSTGNVGLIAGTYDIPGTDILFDNFTVRQP